ncbi:MAG: hypothetical protein QXQ76_03095 [Candidatus Bathyarchaeia archaeon]
MANETPSPTIKPAVGFCREFRTKPEHLSSGVGIVIAPIRIADLSNARSIAWSCSAGPYCQSPFCRYSAYNKQMRQNGPDKALA